MQTRHLLLAVSITAIWGLNFAVGLYGQHGQRILKAIPRRCGQP